MKLWQFIFSKLLRARSANSSIQPSHIIMTFTKICRKKLEYHSFSSSRQNNKMHPTFYNVSGYNKITKYQFCIEKKLLEYNLRVICKPVLKTLDVFLTGYPNEIWRLINVNVPKKLLSGENVDLLTNCDTLYMRSLDVCTVVCCVLRNQYVCRLSAVCIFADKTAKTELFKRKIFFGSLFLLTNTWIALN